MCILSAGHRRFLCLPARVCFVDFGEKASVSHAKVSFRNPGVSLQACLEDTFDCPLEKSPGVCAAFPDEPLAKNNPAQNTMFDLTAQGLARLFELSSGSGGSRRYGKGSISGR
jgi:hypothetical protein